MSERPKLSLPGKGKADFPPKPPVQEDAPFDVSDSRRKANETIDSLKNSLYAAGLSPAQVSKQWAAARVNHDSLLRTLEEHKEAGTPERKKELERAFAEKLAALKGDQSDDLQEAVQESYLAKPKKRTSRRKQGMSDGKAEKLIEQGIAASNSAELESSEARRKEIRDRLGFLESVASTRDVEKEALRLEAELRAREKTDPIDSLEGADSKELLGEAQGESVAEPTPVPTADETPKEAHDRLESLISGYAGEPHHSVPAVMDGPEPRRTGAAETPDVIALKDHSGRKKRPAETLEAMTALTEAQKRAQGAEEEYLSALKEYQKKRALGGVMLDGIVDTDRFAPEKLKELRRQWVRARATFAGAQGSSAEVRLKAKGRDEAHRSRVTSRYERMVTVRSVVLGAEEREIGARAEGLASREQKSLEQIFEWYKKLPPGVRIVGTSAALMGGSALIAGGALPGLAVLGFGGASAAVRVLAEKQKNPAAKKFLAGISSVPALAGFLAKSGIDLYHQAAGTEEEAEKVLAQTDRLGLLSDEKNLERISAKRKGALVAGENIERQGRLARFAASIGAGWLFGHAVGGGHHDHADHAAAPEPSPEATPAHGDAVPPHANEPRGLKVEQAPLAKPEVAPVEHPAAPEHAQHHAAVRHESPAANPAQPAESQGVAPMSSEDKIAEIYKYQAEHNGLPAGSDANIDETIEHIEHHDLEPAQGDVPAPEATAPAIAEPVQPEHAPDPVQPPGAEAESASSSSVLPGEPAQSTIEQPYEAAPAVENSSVPAESAASAPENSDGMHEAAATPELNQNGFDLSRPDAAMVHGKYFGYGHTTKESYDQAVTLLMKNPKLHDGTPVYWTERQPGIFGDKIIVHALRFKPGEMVSPQPYAVDDALKPVVMPPVPKPGDYQPIPTR